MYIASSFTARRLPAGRSVAKPLLALSIDAYLLENEEIGATGDCQANDGLMQRNWSILTGKISERTKKIIRRAKQ